MVYTDRGRVLMFIIMPGILADFEEMLRKSSRGMKLTEQYALEDRKGIVVLEGYINSNNRSEINVDVKRM